MKSFRENPYGEENQRASRDNEMAVFAAKMQAEQLGNSEELDEQTSELKPCHCCRPGMVNGDVSVEELPNALGGTYFKATQPIGYLFGSRVHGELEGIGATKEQALERLKLDRDNLYEGLWA
jgi:hypothetical protein